MCLCFENVEAHIKASKDCAGKGCAHDFYTLKHTGRKTHSMRAMRSTLAQKQCAHGVTFFLSTIAHAEGLVFDLTPNHSPNQHLMPRSLYPITTYEPHGCVSRKYVTYLVHQSLCPSKILINAAGAPPEHVETELFGTSPGDTWHSLLYLLAPFNSNGLQPDSNCLYRPLPY